jgi:hypothetical protein
MGLLLCLNAVLLGDDMDWNVEPYAMFQTGEVIMISKLNPKAFVISAELQ